MTWQFAETDTLTLIHICNHDDIDLDTRYKAANELQYRRIPNEIQAEILYLSGIGKPIEVIAYESGYSEEQIKALLDQMKTKHKERFKEVPQDRVSNRVNGWEKGKRYFRR